MKWLPPPSVPELAARALPASSLHLGVELAEALHQRRRRGAQSRPAPRRQAGSSCGVEADRDRLLDRARAAAAGRRAGRSASRLVSTAAMPQPMSTPTAAGATAPRIAITEPTVAPLPRCTSGMTATWCATQGSAAMFLSWSSAARLDLLDAAPTA